jgi:hypothetical protein
MSQERIRILYFLLSSLYCSKVILSHIYKKPYIIFIINHVMNYRTDTEPGSSGSAVLNNEAENENAIKEIQVKLKELVPSLHNSINLTTIKDLESRVSNLEEKVEQILRTLESRKIT